MSSPLMGVHRTVQVPTVSVMLDKSFLTFGKEREQLFVRQIYRTYLDLLSSQYVDSLCSLSVREPAKRNLQMFIWLVEQELYKLRIKSLNEFLDKAKSENSQGVTQTLSGEQINLRKVKDVWSKEMCRLSTQVRNDIEFNQNTDLKQLKRTLEVNLSFTKSTDSLIDVDVEEKERGMLVVTTSSSTSSTTLDSPESLKSTTSQAFSRQVNEERTNYFVVSNGPAIPETLSVKKGGESTLNENRASLKFSSDTIDFNNDDEIDTPRSEESTLQEERVVLKFSSDSIDSNNDDNEKDITSLLIPFYTDTREKTELAEKFLKMLINSEDHKPSKMATLSNDASELEVVKEIDDEYFSSIETYKESFLKALHLDQKLANTPRNKSLDFSLSVATGAARVVAKVPDVPVFKHVAGPIFGMTGAIYGMCIRRRLTNERIEAEQSVNRGKWITEVILREQTRVKAAVEAITKRFTIIVEKIKSLQKLQEEKDPKIALSVDHPLIKELVQLDSLMIFFSRRTPLKVNDHSIFDFIAQFY